MRRILTFARPVAILAVAILIAVVMLKSKPRIEPRPTQIPPPVVEVQTIELGAVPVDVVAYGNVAASSSLDLVAQVVGEVTWKSPLFEPGTVVTAGQPLLRIDPTDYELALAEANQSLASARLSLADAKSLKQTARVEEAEAAVAAATARIARAQRDLANTEVVAPYDAVVDEQLVESGQFISVGARLGRLLGAERAEIRLAVTPQDIQFLESAIDAPVTITQRQNGQGTQWVGRVARLEARFDTDTRVLPVVVEVEQPLDSSRHQVPLRFGQFVRVEIQGDVVNNAVRLPLDALHGDDDVFLFDDGKLHRRHVEVARISEGGALVTAGLNVGERVVTTRLDLMFEGLAVGLRDDS